METPEEFLMKYGIRSDTTIGIEGDKKLTELLEEYASQALRIQDVVGRSEQLPQNFCTLNRQTCGKGSGCKYPHCHL